MDFVPGLQPDIHRTGTVQSQVKRCYRPPHGNFIIRLHYVQTELIGPFGQFKLAGHIGRNRCYLLGIDIQFTVGLGYK